MAKTKNTYKNTYNVLEDYGLRITDEIVDLLAKNRRRRNGKSYPTNASFKLSNSIDFDVVKSKVGYQLVLYYTDYGPKRVINQKTGEKAGNIIRGRKAGSKPPPIKDIIVWIKQKKIPINVEKGSKSGRAKKNKNKVLSLAIAISRAINQRGQDPFDFLKPYKQEVTSKQYKDDLRAALLADGYKSLQKPISSFNKKQQTK